MSTTNRIFAFAVGGMLSAMLLKTVIFMKVSEETVRLREKEHASAVNHLQDAYNMSRQFELPPLTEEEREKLRLHFSHFRDISKFDPKFDVSEEKPKSQKWYHHLVMKVAANGLVSDESSQRYAQNGLCTHGPPDQEKKVVCERVTKLARELALQ
eukprot:scaffold4257_cov157-Ochromonas_danica.AAC.2